jgi:hypothetical protein
MSMTVTNNDTVGLVVWDPIYDTDVLVDASAGTYVTGTILGRITASGRLTKYTSGASDGSQNPIAVLSTDVTLSAGVPVNIRPLIGGRVRRSELVLSAGGTPSQAVVDALRSNGIFALTTVNLAKQDNQ